MNIEDQLLDYLEDRLDPTARAEITAKLEQSEELRAELEELQFLSEGLTTLPQRQPSTALRARFQQMLEAESSSVTPAPTSKSKTLYLWIGRAAAVLALFVLGWWTGNQMGKAPNEEIASLREEFQQTQHLMLSLLQKESASERIKAVSFSYEIPDANPEILAALLNTMNDDSNINVRTHAAEALARFGNNPLIRNEFIRGLREQNDPEMQIKLIDILVNLKEERAVGEMLKLLERESLLDAVKFKAEKGVELLL